MIISFFGASVTAQKNGYADNFAILSSEHKFYKHGYGSMHIMDAGICFIDKVLIEKPNYCFLDWFSTGFIDTTLEFYKYLDVIVLKLLEINCVPIFLLLDRKDMNNNRITMYENVINYANKYNIDYISIYNNKNVDLILRDSVHTTDYGGKYYGKIIYEHFIKSSINKKIQDIKNIDTIQKNKFYHVKSLKINKKAYDHIKIIGKADIFGIYQKIGEYSGKIDIIHNDDKINNFVIWDQWCHYERYTIKLSFSVDGKTIIKITNDEFDTSLCKEKIDWKSKIKKIEIQDIYYSGIINEVSVV